jgi:hypothetical protein
MRNSVPILCGMRDFLPHLVNHSEVPPRGTYIHDSPIRGCRPIRPGSLVMPKRHPECWVASVVCIESGKALLNIERIWLDE